MRPTAKISMGQVETKVFHSVPPWEAEAACQNTALGQEMVQMCWQKWRKDSRSAIGEFKENLKMFVLLGLRMGRLIILSLFLGQAAWLKIWKRKIG